MKTLTSAKGFTLVEIMIVVAVIGLLALIALPSIYSARVRAQTTACVNNLRQLSSAKDQWAIANNKAEGTPDLSDLTDGFMKRNPVCPAGGTYEMKDISEDPVCSLYDEDTHPAEL